MHGNQFCHCCNSSVQQVWLNTRDCTCCLGVGCWLLSEQPWSEFSVAVVRTITACNGTSCVGCLTWHVAWQEHVRKLFQAVPTRNLFVHFVNISSCDTRWLCLTGEAICSARWRSETVCAVAVALSSWERKNCQKMWSIIYYSNYYLLSWRHSHVLL